MHITDNMQKATFGAGCFWGVEAAFQHKPGVISTTVGFLGGHTKNPSYNDVCTDTTGHAEVVHIIFDPSISSYEKLLDIFWDIHNPTQYNKQGPDIGSQYRSVIFYYNEKQRILAEKSKQRLNNSNKYTKPIVTGIVKATEFYPAEEYHQHYIEKHKSVSCKR